MTAVVAALACVSPGVAAAQGSGFVQVGTSLAPTDAVGAAGFGSAVALSGDGRSMLVGGPEDNGSVGAAWAYQWAGSGWSELQKLTPGAGGGSSPQYGSAVAVSEDGNTALVAGVGSGEVDVYVHAGGVWSFQATLSPQGLVASSACCRYVLSTGFGSSVALSADGNTALVGASMDTCTDCGAVVAFVRSGGSWVQQGPPLRPTDESPDTTGGPKVPVNGFGTSVSLSADGNTALIGDTNDGAGCITGCAGPGAAWIFTRQGQTWSQLGGKITSAGDFFFGTGVLSADGNSALIGGAPAASLITRSGSSWGAQSNAITHYQHFDNGVAFSGDGSTALLTGSQACSGGVAGSFVNTSAGWAAEPQLVDGAQSETDMSDEALSGDGSIAVIGEVQPGSGAGAVLTFAHHTEPFTVPTVTAVTPGALPPDALGTQVAISGSGFSGTTSVTYRGMPAQYFCVASPTEILATFDDFLYPPPLGPADVVVSTPTGSSPTPLVPNFYVTTVPSTPTGITATPSDHAATVTFTASPPTGSPIIYTITAEPSGRIVETSGTHATITGLTPGQPYTFTVLAIDPLGASPPTTSSPVMPYGAPTIGAGRISGLQSGAPTLRFTLHAGTAAPWLRQLTISLPAGLRFRTIRHGISISAKQRLRLIRGRLYILLSAPARQLGIAIAPPALTASASLIRRAQQDANAHRPLNLRFTITVLEPGGTTTTLRASVSSK